MSRARIAVLACLIASIGVGMYFSYQHAQYLHRKQLQQYRFQQLSAPANSSFLKRGQKAPDFILPAFPKTSIRLSGFRHKKNVILAFYPRDGSTGCSREISTLSADMEQFKSADAEVLGISCDSIDSHKQFSSDYDLGVTLLADCSGKVAQEYGVKVNGKLKARRVVFVIDKQGVIQNVITGMPDDNRLLAMVRALN